MARVRGQVGRLETAARARAAVADPAPGLMVVFPDDWPADDLAAFDGGDDAAWADAVERNTGRRPGPRTRLIALRERPDGPGEGAGPAGGAGHASYHRKPV